MSRVAIVRDATQYGSFSEPLGGLDDDVEISDIVSSIFTLPTLIVPPNVEFASLLTLLEALKVISLLNACESRMPSEGADLFWSKRAFNGAVELEPPAAMFSNLQLL